MNKISRADFAIIILFRIFAPILIFIVALTRSNAPLSSSNISTTISSNMNTRRCIGRPVRLEYRGDIDYSHLLNSLLLYGNGNNASIKISILLDPGRTYRINRIPVKLASHTCLIGASTTTTTTNTNNSRTVLSGGLISGRSIRSITLINISVRDGFGIVLENTSDVYVNKLHVAHNFFHGFTIVASENIRAVFSVFEHNKLDGIHIQNVSNALIEQSTSRGNGRDGISMAGKCEKIHVGSNVTIMENARCGISISDSYVKKGRPYIGDEAFELDSTITSRNRNRNRMGSDVLITRTYISSQSGHASICVHHTTTTVRIISSRLIAPVGACYSVASARELVIDENVACIGRSVFSGEISRSECTRGIIVGDICAPLECGTANININIYGGCSRIWAPPACCITRIAQSSRYCACEKPPCIISNAVEQWPLPCIIKNKVLV